MHFLKKNSVVLFFLCWFLLNLFQAGFTELLDDEAYYWVYSKFLAWGYFDHPPMIALLIKAGYYIFPNELGVRLFVSLLSTGTLIILYDLLPQKNKSLFFYIVASIAILQIGGIIAVPDIPLLFFTTLFFWIYLGFLKKSSFANALLLGLSMALMLYSKYHGVLIIFFTLLSNLKLFKQPKAYVAAVFAFLLFLPHLIWQFRHDFPSIQYHLFERNPDAYKVSFTVDYILGQILLAGPIMGWLFIWRSFRYKTNDLFERALKFSLVGIYLFFLLSSFKGRVEANWTVPALIPLILLSYQSLLTAERWKNVLRISVPITLLMVLIVRIFMIIDIPTVTWIEKDEFHQNKKWVDHVKEKASDLPVVFINSYQKASKYWFYSGNTSFSLNTPYYRRNNFNFWPIEDSLFGKKVYAVILEDSVLFPDIIQKIPRIKIARGKAIDSFYSYSTINLVCKKFIVTKNKLNPVIMNVAFADPQNENLKRIPFSFTPFMYVYKADTVFTRYKLLAESASGLWSLRSTDDIDLPKGKYLIRLAIPTAIPNVPSLNSTFYKLTVE